MCVKKVLKKPNKQKNFPNDQYSEAVVKLKEYLFT